MFILNDSYLKLSFILFMSQFVPASHVFAEIFLYVFFPYLLRKMRCYSKSDGYKNGEEMGPIGGVTGLPHFLTVVYDNR